MAKILIVEDDPVIRQLVRDALETERHVVDDCQDGRSGMAFIDAGSYELLVLDWEMPHATGIELCSHFRKQGEQAPVLFLTARASMDDKEKGFAVGANDYLTKPFDVRELLIRVKALLKRPQQISKDILKVGAMELDTNSGVVKRNEALIRLQPRELALLEFLMRHPGTFFYGRSPDGTGLGHRLGSNGSGSAQLHNENAPQNGCRKSTIFHRNFEGLRLSNQLQELDA